MPDQVSDAGGGQPGPADAIFEGTGDAWWDEFFADRAKPIPFFTDWPDENLAEWFSSGQLGPGRVLELGCGNGRNAIYLAGQGCTVDGLVCFRPEGGSGYTDQQVDQRSSLGGGLGYSEDQLRALWDKPPFAIRELRQMHKTSQHRPHFGEDFLHVLLATRETRQ